MVIEITRPVYFELPCFLLFHQIVKEWRFFKVQFRVVWLWLLYVCFIVVRNTINTIVLCALAQRFDVFDFAQSRGVDRDILYNTI